MVCPERVDCEREEAMAPNERPNEAEPGNAARPASLRDRKRTRIKRMLQAEALRLFAEKGYEATTVEDIADAAAISPRTFFRYFPSKEDVVVWDEHDMLAPEFWESRPAGEPVAESVRAFFRQGLKGLYDQDRDRLLARLRLIFTIREIRARYWSDQAGNPSVIGSWLADRDTPPDDLQVRVVFLAIMYAAAVALERWQAGGGKGDILVLFDQAVDALAAGMRDLRPVQPTAG
jgi:AcrR family transcriptional regulator